ncbi:MAG TPA: hypothetical protein VNR18_06380, partial [Hyphomicrobiales bacterium]|nr:hypothetical protein [Hyphomicrobiales bacterium]
MAGKKNEFETVLIIKGDDKGGITAVKATREELDKLDTAQEKGSKSSKKLGKEQNQAAKETRSFGEAVKSGVTALAQYAAAAAAATIAYVGYNTKHIQETDRLAKQLGISTQAFMAQSQAVKLAGLDQEGYADAIRDITVKVQELATVGKGAAEDFFAHTNANIQELARLAPDELLARIGEELRHLNRNERIMFLDQLGSDKAVALVDIIDRMDELEHEAIAVGAALSDIDAATVNLAAEGLDRVAMVAQGAGNQITAALAPIVSDLAERLVGVAVEAGGVEKAAVQMVDVTVQGLGIVADRVQDLLILQKRVELFWKSIGLTVLDVMASSGDSVANVLNYAKRAVGAIAEVLAPIVDFAAKVGGPLGEDLEALSAILETFGEDSKTFSINASDIQGLADGLRGNVIETKRELQALLDTPPPSDRLPEWLAQVRAAAEAAATAEVEARKAQEASNTTTAHGSQVVADLVEQMEFENALLGKATVTQKVQTALRKLDATATQEQRMQVARLVTERHNAELATAKQTEREKELAKTRENQIENVQRYLDEGLYRALTDSAEDWGDYFDGIAKGYARLYTSMVSKNLVDAIFNGGSTNLSDILGITKLAGGSGTGGGDTAGLLGSLGNIGSTLGKIGSSVGKLFGLGGTSGAALSSAQAAALNLPASAAAGTGLMSTLGAVAPWLAGGALLYTAFDGFKGDDWQRSSVGFSVGDPAVVKPKYEYGTRTLSSGLELTLINRRGDQAASDSIAGVFEAIHDKVVEMVEEHGGKLDLSGAVLQGTHADYGVNTGNFFGLRGGENGLESEAALNPLLASFTKQILEHVEGLDAEVQQALRNATGDAASLMQAFEDALTPSKEAAEAELEFQRRRKEGITSLVASYKDLTAGVASLRAAITNDINTALGAYVLRPSGSDAESMLAAISVERQANLDAYQEEVAHLRELHALKVRQYEEQLALAEEIDRALHNTALSDLAPLSQAEKLDLAQKRFDELIAAGMTGDAEAGREAVTAREELLALARERFTGSQAFIDIYSRSETMLAQLGSVVASASAPGELDLSSANDKLYAASQSLLDKLGQVETGVNVELVKLLKMLGVKFDELPEELNALLPKDTAYWIEQISKLSQMPELFGEELVPAMGFFIERLLANGAFIGLIADSIVRAGPTAVQAANDYLAEKYPGTTVEDNQTASNPNITDTDIAEKVNALKNAPGATEESVIR